MATSYAALVSLNNLIHTVLNHPNPPISLHPQQAEALIQKITFLQDFLQLYSHRDDYPTDDLEIIISETACAAEDVIESYIVDQIGGSTSHGESWWIFKMCFKSSTKGDRFYQDLQKVVEDVDKIEQKAKGITEKWGDDQDFPDMSLKCHISPASPSLVLQSEVDMVGSEDIFTRIIDILTDKWLSRRIIIPIVGMGGIGKATLALKAFRHVTYDFDIRVWARISEKFNTRDILLEILCQGDKNSRQTFSHMREEELGVIIHKRFSGMRYLLVMEDMWGIEPWDEVRRFFPDNHNGSRIIITSRITSIALQLNSSCCFSMDFLDDNESWCLLCKIVFRENACPVELETIGKLIAKNCKGFPLSIVVIGGFLAKSKPTKQHWESVSRNLSSIVNLVGNEWVRGILHISYKELPIHLKPCFLYMGIFCDDSTILVSRVVKLLIAEGFVKPIGDDKFMDVVAREYINDLADRNLILVHERGSLGNIKSFKIHNLLRDLCLEEAHKGKFYYVVKTEEQLIQGDMTTQRRIIVDMEPHTSWPRTTLCSLSYATTTRSFIWNGEAPLPMKFRLLRLLTVDKEPYFPVNYLSWVDAFQFYNIRLLPIQMERYAGLTFPPISLFWNLQMLIVSFNETVTAPVEVWRMSQLRHAKFQPGVRLPNPPDDGFVLGNLRSLSGVSNFECSEVVLTKIPNVRKLCLQYNMDMDFPPDRQSYYCLEGVHKLEKLSIFWGMNSAAAAAAATLMDSVQSLTFPPPLKKLKFESHIHDWKFVTARIGVLPNLVHLRLEFIRGSEWISIAGKFLHLRTLHIVSCDELETWTIDSTDFPLLEHVSLCNLSKLKELPQTLGELPNLQSIKLDNCRDSCIISAKEIAEEQEELGNLELRVHTTILDKNEEIENLASSNFIVDVGYWKPFFGS